jgi:hypothetical protein
MTPVSTFEPKKGVLAWYRWNPGWSLVLWRWQIDRHHFTDGSKSLWFHRRRLL